MILDENSDSCHEILRSKCMNVRIAILSYLHVPTIVYHLLYPCCLNIFIEYLLHLLILMVDGSSTEQLDCARLGQFGEVAYHVRGSEQPAAREISPIDSDLKEKISHIYQVKSDRQLQSMKCFLYGTNCFGNF